MDEVDGMSAGDRGGVGALNALIKKSKVPLFFLSVFMSQRKLYNFPFRSLSFVLRMTDKRRNLNL
jgi:replication factor C subunit 1